MKPYAARCADITKTTMAYRILLVDDEADILEFIRYNLEKEDYEVFMASNGREAVETALRVVPHLILLDVMMPEMDGIETCREIRSHDSLRRTLIAFLTARGEDYSQIHVRVLLSRIRAMLKRFDSTVRDADGQSCGVVIDRERYLVFCEGRQLTLPRKEFELLSLLCSKPQKVFSREEIFANVWGSDVIVGDRTIDVHVRKLREKLGDRHIVTVKGVGYKFED